MLRRRVEDVLRDLGFDALVTLSLTEPRVAERLRIPAEDPRARPIKVSNPLSQEHSAQRTMLLGSLLDAAAYNLAHGAERVALFESGRAYLAEGSSPVGGPLAGDFPGERPPPAFEPHRLGALAIGPLRPADWRVEGRPADFFTVKAVLEALAAQIGVVVEVEASAEPFLHPGRAGAVAVGGHVAGWIGELHPLVCRAWDLEEAAGFEIDLAPMVAESPYGAESYEDVISFPAVHQDIAVVVAEDIDAASVRDAVLAGGGELLRMARIFDVYRGEQLGEDRKSLALRLEFRALDRTLTDEEVAGLREQIRAKLAEIGGSLRE
jgi:phenylalanyl-tRNA synthetase beta chain